MKIGYARVSTQQQSPDRQRDALEAEGCERVYIDKISGRAADLPGREDALSQLREGDVLVVRSLSRLGRSIKDLIEIVERIEEKGARFESISEGFDTSTPGGRFFFHVFAALSHFRIDIIRERTKDGLRAAKRRGRTPGRPAALYRHQQKVAAEMIEDPRYSVRDICERFGIASRSTLYKYISPDGEIRKQAPEKPPEE